MDNKLLQKLKQKLEPNKIKIIIILGLIGMLFILCSEASIFKNDNKIVENNQNKTCINYVEDLELRTKKIIESIDGVGKCNVMITVSQSNENIYAKNIDESNQHGYYSQNNEYVLYKDDNGETPVLIKENFPKITGVAVVCDGADDINVKKQVLDTICSLFDISTSHISISKIKQ